MRILFIGDIVGKPGRDSVEAALGDLKDTLAPDVIIANSENIANGRGVTEKNIEEMMHAGVNFFTGGDHTFWNRDLYDCIDRLPQIRPANYPGDLPGKGYSVIDVAGKKLLVINLMGRTFLNERLDDPFQAVDRILAQTSDQQIDEILVDFHAEATSEKYALGFYLDGKVSAVLGTHTHVPTCDNRILPRGTAFVADVGMCGNIDSVLGVKKEIILQLYTTGLNQKFEWENAGTKAFRSVIIDTTENTIERADKVYT